MPVLPVPLVAGALGNGAASRDELAARLRALPTPVIGHIRDGGLILDLRCLDTPDLLLRAIA